MTALQHLKQLAVEWELEHSPLPPHAQVIASYRQNSANAITRCIIDWFKFNHGVAYRISVQGQWDEKHNMWRKGHMRKGLPDIIAIHEGQFWGIEVKFGKDRMSEHQMKIRDEILDAGGVYMVARTFDQFYRDYNALK